jgi:hypothetical protein
MNYRVVLRTTGAAIFAGVLAFGCVVAPSTQEIATKTAEPNFAPTAGSGLSVYSDPGKSSSLLFLGTSHTFDETNPQILDIERLFHKFRPSIVLVEGGDWQVAATKKSAIRLGGEMGLVTYLAAENGTKAQSLEPRFEDEVSFVLAAYQPLDVKLFYSLRMVSQFRRQQSPDGLVERMNHLLGGRDLGAMPKLDISPMNVEELSVIFKSRFPALIDWQQIDPFVVGLPREADGSDTLNQIRKRSEAFRNAQMARLILSHLKDNHRVLVVAGTNHMVALMPLLRQQ